MICALVRLLFTHANDFFAHRFVSVYTVGKAIRLFMERIIEMEQKLEIADPERIVYSLNVEDLQTVANDEISRDLTEEEIKIVEENVGDYITWYQAISLAITDMLDKREQDS